MNLEKHNFELETEYILEYDIENILLIIMCPSCYKF